MFPVAITKPGPAVSLAEVKAHLRVTHNKEDRLYETYLAAAIDRIETETGQVFVERQFEWKLPCFTKEILIPIVPLKTIDQIQYFDADDAPQTVTLADVYVDREVAATLRHRTAWPATATRDDAVTITFTAGHGATPEDVPEKARLCALLYVAHYDDHRSAVETGTIATVIPEAAKSLIRSLSVGRYSGQ